MLVFIFREFLLVGGAAGKSWDFLPKRGGGGKVPSVPGKFLYPEYQCTVEAKAYVHQDGMRWD